MKVDCNGAYQFLLKDVFTDVMDWKERDTFVVTVACSYIRFICIVGVYCAQPLKRCRVEAQVTKIATFAKLQAFYGFLIHASHAPKLPRFVCEHLLPFLCGQKKLYLKRYFRTIYLWALCLMVKKVILDTSFDGFEKLHH